METAKKERGTGLHDVDYSFEMVTARMRKWKRSGAVTPDLVVRAAYKCTMAYWQRAIWQVQRLMSPACLASRPDLWRGVALDTRYKSGSQLILDSYRLLAIRSQMGLLQEGLLSDTCGDTIRAGVHEGQSGYSRDVSDPQLLLAELTAIFDLEGRFLLIVMADFRKAFPRVWRPDLLTQIFGAGIGGGAFVLFGGILARDVIHVWL